MAARRIWTRWTSVRKVKEGETTNDLYAFLTTEPNAIVASPPPRYGIRQEPSGRQAIAV